MPYDVKKTDFQLSLRSLQGDDYRRQRLMTSPVGSLDSDIFREMVDNAHQGIMVHRSHRPLYVNRAWARIHGYTIDEIMAMPELRIWHESEFDRLNGYAEKRLTGGSAPTRYRFRALHKTGRPIWVEQFVRVIDWQGEKAIQSTIIDVDDQEKRADEWRRQQQSMEEEVRQRTEALQRSSRQLHLDEQIINQVSERISVVDVDYRYRLTNQANMDFWRRPQERFVGHHVRDIIGETWFESKGRHILDRCFAGYSSVVEHPLEGPDKEPCFVSVTAEPFREPDGSITGAILSVRDITEERHSQRRLRQFGSVIEQISDRISVVDTGYHYQLTNKANLEFYGRSREEMLGHHIAEMIGEDLFLSRTKADFDRCFKGETVRVRRQHKNAKAQLRTVDILLEPYREPSGLIAGGVVTIRDVTEAEKLSKRLAYQARHDQLTELVNRQAFEQSLQAVIADTANNNLSGALCFIDLDQFKIVNDTVGHLVGDRLLQQVAKLLTSKIGEGDVLARLGGDEFGLLLHGCSLRRAKRAAEHLITALNRFQFFHDDMMFEVGASIGITAINRHTQGVNDVMAQADLACYAAKDKGRNQVQIYQKRDQFIRQRREEMYRTGGIRTALDKGQFMLFAQPITAIRETDEDVKRVEVLLRMIGERGKLIMPSAFIPAAERYGFMAEVDRWVIRETIGHLARSNEGLAGTAVNINLSGVTLNDETSLDFIRQALISSGVSPDRISFEITETAAVRNVMKTKAFMQELRDWGCTFALDDFGSGVSSLSYLKRLPVDYLKIDGSFTRDVTKDRGSRVMVKAIHCMARGLGIQTVAEGVEDQPTLNALRDLGIDHVQGFAIGSPSPLDIG